MRSPSVRKNSPLDLTADISSNETSARFLKLGLNQEEVKILVPGIESVSERMKVVLSDYRDIQRSSENNLFGADHISSMAHKVLSVLPELAHNEVKKSVLEIHDSYLALLPNNGKDVKSDFPAVFKAFADEEMQDGAKYFNKSYGHGTESYNIEVYNVYRGRDFGNREKTFRSAFGRDGDGDSEDFRWLETHFNFSKVVDACVGKYGLPEDLISDTESKMLQDFTFRCFDRVSFGRYLLSGNEWLNPEKTVVTPENVHVLATKAIDELFDGDTMKTTVYLKTNFRGEKEVPVDFSFITDINRIALAASNGVKFTDVSNKSIEDAIYQKEWSQYIVSFGEKTTIPEDVSNVLESVTLFKNGNIRVKFRKGLVEGTKKFLSDFLAKEAIDTIINKKEEN